MLVLTKAPLKSREIWRVRKNVEINVTRRKVLETAPKKFDRVPVSFPNHFPMYKMPVTGEFERKLT